jgi:hypothetical protein
MRTDKKIIDSQLSAIETMKSEFLRFANYSEVPSPEELNARHERINEALANCGDSLDGYWVSWLFNELEQRAVDELRKVTLLAQTTDPYMLKEKYFPDLPQQLVDNAKTVHKHFKKKGASLTGNDAKKRKKDLFEEEIIIRSKWFLDNPVLEYKGNLESCRSNKLAKIISENWYTRKRDDPLEQGMKITEYWENGPYQPYYDQEHPSGPSIGRIQGAIKKGVNSKRLPKFLTDLKPKK